MLLVRNVVASGVFVRANVNDIPVLTYQRNKDAHKVSLTNNRKQVDEVKI